VNCLNTTELNDVNCLNTTELNAVNCLNTSELNAVNCLNTIGINAVNCLNTTELFHFQVLKSFVENYNKFINNEKLNYTVDWNRGY
jgi:hypothetical protein